MKVQLVLELKTIDTVALMLAGQVMHMEYSDPKYLDKVQATVEFLEEAMDPSFGSVAVYLTVLSFLPEVVKRKIPYRIEEFINMYQRQVEEALGGPIPAKYAPKKIITQEATILDMNGNPIGG